MTCVSMKTNNPSADHAKKAWKKTARKFHDSSDNNAAPAPAPVETESSTPDRHWAARVAAMPVNNGIPAVLITPAFG